MTLRRVWTGIIATSLAVIVGSGCTIDGMYHGDLAFPFWMPIPVAPWKGDRIAEHLEKDYSQVRSCRRSVIMHPYTVKIHQVIMTCYGR